MTELKNELELLMKGKFHEHFKNHEAKQQIVLDLMGDLEKKMDHRGQEIMDDLRAEVNRLFDDRGQRFE